MLSGILAKLGGVALRSLLGALADYLKERRTEARIKRVGGMEQVIEYQRNREETRRRLREVPDPGVDDALDRLRSGSA